MRINLILIVIPFLVGCSIVPPDPPEVEGEYRPVNRTMPMQPGAITTAQDTFDYLFEGDIVDALPALQKVQPQITVLPPIGKRVLLPVRFILHATTLENALKAIGEQGEGVTDVIWNTNQAQEGNQVFIRYRTVYKKSAYSKKRRSKS